MMNCQVALFEEGVMRAKVTESGITLPRDWFEGAAEVEIRREEHCVVVVPVRASDPIAGLGSNPIMAHVDDASARHDSYLYGQ
jgi:hypothetical protein